MQDSWALPSAVGRLYETMLDEHAESAWLDALRDSIGAEHAVLSDTTGTCLSMHISRVDEDMIPLAHRLAATTMYDPALVRMPVHAACRMSDFFPMRELMRTDLYAQLVRPLHGGHALAFTWRHGRGRAAIAICRDATRKHDYGDDEIALLQPLLQHFHNAFQIRLRLQAQQAALEDAHAALDAMHEAVLIVDAGCRVRYLNSAARSLLLEADALQIDRNTLRAARSQDDHRLRSLVRDVLDIAHGAQGRTRGTSPSPAGVGGLPFAIRREPARRPLLVSAAPARGTMRLHDTPAFADAAMLFLRDPDRLAAPGIDALVELFRLTRREAQLASVLQAGDPLSVAAVRLGITEGTARQYLKSVFAKTGVERQSELVGLLRNLG